MIPRHGKTNRPNKRPCISIGACMKAAKNGEALDLLAAMGSNGSALNTKTMAIKRQSEPETVSTTCSALQNYSDAVIKLEVVR